MRTVSLLHTRTHAHLSIDGQRAGLSVVMRISSLVLLAIFLLGARCEASQVGVVHQLANAKHPTLRLLQGGSADAGCRPLGVACYGGVHDESVTYSYIMAWMCCWFIGQTASVAL
mmetsp:Transcript_15052/g.43172  ORF Transcript_15052/g.43172 Transcript_15052/m.43172 type:complete len:115 (+) Transcript_15052:83-427(+)